MVDVPLPEAAGFVIVFLFYGLSNSIDTHLFLYFFHLATDNAIAAL